MLGDIVKISAKEILTEPEGWSYEKEQFNLPFAIELRENFHIHWQDIRIEMMPEDFENFFIAMNNAYQEWVKDGKPRKLDEAKRYGFWPGEEGYDFHKDRDKKFNKFNQLCHHFRKFPRTEKEKLFFDSVLQVELQRRGHYHIHYKNFRIELGKNRVKQMAKALQNTVEDMNQNSTDF